MHTGVHERMGVVFKRSRKILIKTVQKNKKKQKNLPLKILFNDRFLKIQLFGLKLSR